MGAPHMIVVDANVLIYAVNGDADLHEPVGRWLDGELNGPTTIGFAWIVLLAFLRITTSARIMPSPLTPTEAGAVVRGWVSRPNAVTVTPSADHLSHLSRLTRLLADSGTAGNLVSDAHLAALALEHRATIATFDTDFARFDGVTRIRPR